MFRAPRLPTGSLLFAFPLALVGCATHTGTGTLIGSGFGAATGAIIGSATGNAGTGAVIGAGTGALIGGLAGNADDAIEQRDAAFAHAARVDRERALYSHPPMTNGDLVTMARGNLSAEVILEAVRARGGRFDLSPGGLVGLKQSGVGDDVIVGVQRLSQPTGDVYVSHVEAEPAPKIVVVRPRPAVGVVVGPAPPPFGCRHRHRRGPRAHIGFSHHW